MRKLKLFSASVAIAFSALFPALLAHAQEAQTGKAFLWQVTKGDQKLYLLGGLSHGKRSLYPMPAIITKAAAEADVFVLESDSKDSEGGEQAFKLGTYAGNDSLDKHLDPALYDDLVTALLDRDIPEAEAKTLKPWMLYFKAISKTFEEAGFESAYSTDEMVNYAARAFNKPLVGMETQLAMAEYLERLSPELQAAMLKGLIAEMKDGTAVKTLSDLWDAWKRGDATRFESIVVEADKVYPQAGELREQFFYSRHAAMVDKLQGYLATGKTHLVVVGAVNLVGERSLVNELKKKGYAVEQL